MSLCHTLKRISIQTWNRIYDSRKYEFQLLEESITDFNLLELKKNHNSQIFIKKFTKNVESKVGADWEWWMKGKNGMWIGLRIQAKIINIASNKFEHLHYKKIGVTETQCEILINNSLKTTIPTFPLYCLYLNDDKITKKQKRRYGCSLISAFEVKRLSITKTNELKDIHHYIFPWHLIICNGYSGNGNFVDNIQDFLKKTFSLPDEYSESVFVTNEPPTYVSQILTEATFKEIRSDDQENLAGVVVIKE